MVVLWWWYTFKSLKRFVKGLKICHLGIVKKSLVTGTKIFLKKKKNKNREYCKPYKNLSEDKQTLAKYRRNDYIMLTKTGKAAQ